MKRILTLALSVVLLLAMLITDVGAIAVEFIYEEDPKTKKPTEVVDYEATVKQYLTLQFDKPEDKLATMTMMYANEGYELWVDELTGEVATKDLASGQVLFSNPYDIGSTYADGKGPSEATKKNIFSQVIIKYDDNGTDKTMYSFEEAAMRGQIKVKNIKGGIRVEYSIGREETRMLVPKVIEKNAFETKILDAFADEINQISREAADEGLLELNWRDYKALDRRNKASLESGNALWFNFMQLFAYYQLKAESECTTDREKISMNAAYPITKQMDVYVFATDATQTETIKCETYIKTYCPSYTFEQLEIDHAKTGYEGTDKNPALFKLSLEYMLDEKGMSVRCPANGLRFNEALYQLNYMSLLPYIGAGANFLLGNPTEKFTGYNFFPDGSGTLFRFEELAGTTATTINAKVYGFDYAYNEIIGNHTEVVRYPVYGSVTNYHDTRTKTEEVETTPAVKDETGKIIAEAEYETVQTNYTYTEDKGFVAIIEEGDALAELSTYHEGALSKYNSIRMMFYPRPKDSYNLANAISVGANATWTVVSSRKYVGNYKIRYIMLTDAQKAKENEIKDYYEVSWMGMAEAYRDYLYDKGELKALEAKDVKEDIPAYIETFGATETVEKILSVPVNVMTALTSFDNVKTMYDELSAEGVKNIKFKLTGYANGGLFASIPYKLKWEKAVGGADGFEDLLAYADEKGFEVFPDFNFSYVRANTNTLFDGLTVKKHIVKSINNTYMSRRYYSATRQTMMGRFELAVSAAYYSHFYEKLSGNLLDYYKDGKTTTISVATLGNALNSDFDEDEPYNREDSKKSTVQALEYLSENFDDVMTESANAYTWKYVDYILNLPLDSSRYAKSAASVPFIGVVLHGSKQFSGSPLNMEGNIGYSLLKAIENGAGVYFVLCYQNYAVLKDSPILSEYYSVRYEILKEDVVKYYTLVNDLTKDLQTERITSHQFLIGERVPDADEVEADRIAAEEAAEKAKKDAEELAEKIQSESLLNGRVSALSASQKLLDKVVDYYNQITGYNEGGVKTDATGAVTVYTGMQTLVDRVLAATAAKTTADALMEAAEKESNYYNALVSVWGEASKDIRALVEGGKLKAYSDLIAANDTVANSLKTALENVDTKNADIDTALKTAVAKGVENIKTLVSDYEKAAEDPDKQKAALEKIELYAGSLANAQRYVSLKNSIDTLKKQYEGYATSYQTNSTYLALVENVAAADEVYSSAKAANADKIANKEYVAADKKLTAAKADLNAYIETLNTRILGCTRRLADFTEGEKEYTLIENLLRETEQELIGLTAGTVTNSYTEAVAAAEAALDALEPTVGAARAKLSEAQKALDAYVADFTANYAESPDYKALENRKIAAENSFETLRIQLENASPLYGALNTVLQEVATRFEESQKKANLENGYLNTAKYKELRAAADKAAAAFAEINEKLVNGMENDATYKTYKKNYEDAKVALEKYTLAYKNNTDFQPLAEAEAKVSSAITKLLNEYQNEAAYKTLKDAAEKANSEYEQYIKTVTVDASKAMSKDVYTQLQAKVEAKAKADSELKAYVAAQEEAVLKSAEYKNLQTQYKAAETAISNYVEIFMNKLAAAAEDAKKAKHPEETDGGKYSAADKAFTEAENLYMYYSGQKALPSGTTKYTSYAKSIEDNKEFKDAKTAKDNAEKAVNDYKTSYTDQIKATAEDKIAAITDPEIKAANAQYRAADAAYTAATTAFNTDAKELSALDAGTYTAVNAYYSALLTVITNNTNKAVAEKNLEVSSLKAEYDVVYGNYADVLNAYASAKANADSSAIALTEIAAENKTATDAQAAAISAVRTQNIRVKNLEPSLASVVADIRKNLADSNLAVELMGDNATYAQSLRDALKESNKQIVDIEKQIHDYSDQIIVYAKKALDISGTILEVDKNFNDPYAEKTVTTEEKKTNDGDETYKYTKYTDDSGNIVRVGYSNGVVFYLNYNYFAVTTVYDGVTYEIPAYGVIRINADGTVCEAKTASRISDAE